MSVFLEKKSFIRLNRSDCFLWKRNLKKTFLGSLRTQFLALVHSLIGKVFLILNFIPTTHTYVSAIYVNIILRYVTTHLSSHS